MKTQAGSPATFDWIDLVAIIVVFGGFTVLTKLTSGASVLDSSTTRLAGPGLLALALGVRRSVFGMPERGELRQSFLWSVAGVLTVLGMVAGIGALGLGFVLVTDAAKAEPAPAPMPRSPMNDLPPELFGEVDHAAEEAQWRANAHRAWVEERSRTTDRGAVLVLVGASLLAIGAMLDRARYVKPTASTPMAEAHEAS